jgi:hypothetical protein
MRHKARGVSRKVRQRGMGKRKCPGAICNREAMIDRKWVPSVDFLEGEKIPRKT